MKVLVAVASYVGGIRQGFNHAIRNTWGKDLPADWDLKFFIGHAPHWDEAQDSPAYRESLQSDWYRMSVPDSHKQPPLPLPPDLDLRRDEIIVNVPDSYRYLSYKVKAAVRYAARYHYTHIFQVSTDTYVNVPALLELPRTEDYIGCFLDNGYGPYATGGAGYWLSTKALQILVGEPIDHFADDVWIGRVMQRHGIPLTINPRFNNEGFDPGDITGHLHCCVHEKPYSVQMMYDAHNRNKQC